MSTKLEVFNNPEMSLLLKTNSSGKCFACNTTFGEFCYNCVMFHKKDGEVKDYGKKIKRNLILDNKNQEIPSIVNICSLICIRKVKENIQILALNA